MQRTAALAVVAAFTSLALTACGSESADDSKRSDKPAATASSSQAEQPASSAPAEDGELGPKPCSLLKPADLQQVLGGSFSSIGESDGAVGSFGEQNCGYVGPDDRTVQIMTNHDDAPGGTAWKAIVQAEENPVMGESVKIPLNGVGDEAFIGSTATVNIRKGTAVAQINLLGEETDSTTEDLLRQLAAIAAKRM